MDLLFFIMALVALVIDLSAAYNFQIGSNGLVMFAFGCDFFGNDIGKTATTGDSCGGICASNPNCDHFTFFNGVCYMKKAVNPSATDLNEAICGWVQKRPSNHIQNAIRTGQLPSRGLNLGGWLVTEYWINSQDALWNGFVSSSVSYKYVHIFREPPQSVCEGNSLLAVFECLTCFPTRWLSIYCWLGIYFTPDGSFIKTKMAASVVYVVYLLLNQQACIEKTNYKWNSVTGISIP